MINDEQGAAEIVEGILSEATATLSRLRDAER
jgi:hypothetical protein